MDTKKLQQLLTDVRSGQVGIDEALSRLKALPFEEIDCARLDLHRGVRQGLPEVVLCENKTTPQVLSILEGLWNHHDRVMATRVSAEMAEAIRADLPEAQYDPTSRLLTLVRPAEGSAGPDADPASAAYAVVVSAGTSDQPVAEEAAQTLEFLGNRAERVYDVGVAGLHRLLSQLDLLFEASVVISVAGMEGALTSVVGGLVACPVVGVPTSVGYGASFSGVTPLLAMLSSCASGVAVVNIDNGFGAGVFAHQTLSGIRQAEAGAAAAAETAARAAVDTEAEAGAAAAAKAAAAAAAETAAGSPGVKSP